MAESSTTIIVSRDALPFLEGHFPGHPIVPGAVLLGWMLDACAAFLEPGRPCQVRRSKFLQPVVPGDEIEIVAERHEDAVSLTARSPATSRIFARATVGQV